MVGDKESESAIFLQHKEIALHGNISFNKMKWPHIYLTLKWKKHYAFDRMISHQTRDSLDAKLQQNT